LVRRELRNISERWPLMKEWIEALYKLYMFTKPLTKVQEWFFTAMNNFGYGRDKILNVNEAIEYISHQPLEREQMIQEDLCSKMMQQNMLISKHGSIVLNSQSLKSLEFVHDMPTILLENLVNKSNAEMTFGKIFLTRIYLTSIYEKMDKCIKQLKESCTQSTADSIYNSNFKLSDAFYHVYLSVERKLMEIELIKSSIVCSSSTPPTTEEAPMYEINDDEQDNAQLKLTEYYCSLTKISFILHSSNNSDASYPILPENTPAVNKEMINLFKQTA
jgi:hypothetical protein